MDTPRDAYEEAIEKMARALLAKHLSEGFHDDEVALLVERLAGTSDAEWLRADNAARAAAEAIGLREMMEALEKLRYAVGRLGGSEAFDTPRAIDPREKELLKRVEFAREYWNV
jgi:hypothetical protein